MWLDSEIVRVPAMNDAANQTSACLTDCPKLRWVFRLLVAAQFILVAILMVASESIFSHWIPLSLSIVAIATGVWAISTMGRFLNVSPKLKENAPLLTTGPYRFVRHPMYLALLLLCGAFVIASGTYYTASLWLAIMFVLACKIRYEEQILHARFVGYPRYAAETKRLIPYIY